MKNYEPKVGVNMQGVNYHAGEMLDSMRPRVERVLEELSKRFSLSTATSQLLRAKDAHDRIKYAIGDLIKCPMTPKTSRDVQNYIDVQVYLQWFIELHHIVSLMEQHEMDRALNLKWLIGGDE